MISPVNKGFKPPQYRVLSHYFGSINHNFPCNLQVPCLCKVWKTVHVTSLTIEPNFSPVLNSLLEEVYPNYAEMDAAQRWNASRPYEDAFVGDVEATWMKV